GPKLVSKASESSLAATPVWLPRILTDSTSGSSTIAWRTSSLIPSLPSAGLTAASTPSNDEEIAESKVSDKVLVNMKEPAIKEVPNTTASRVRASRSLCAKILRKDTLRIVEPLAISPQSPPSPGECLPSSDPEVR